MEIVGYVLLGGYTVALCYVTIYCLMQFHLLYHYSKHHSKDKLDELKDPGLDSNLPFVTIQLPIYNEKYVIERLIDNIADLDYPKKKFEIHILDDSNDETLKIVERKVQEYKGKGFNIEQVLREKRTGFKAGALRDAMDRVKGEFIAIFDADFLPNRDFLKKTIPHFKDEKVGVVQTRWEHINQEYSLITKLQAFQLNVHFSVEQQGRESADYMLQFNGTAGVWRKETIESAGGWEADTLTEDLDLSYRAQLKGWKIHFLEELGSPAELPAEMNGLKSQQFRWMKGGAETAKKILPSVWNSDLGFIKKIHASLHLMNSSVFLFVFLLGVFSVPLLFFTKVLHMNSNIYSLFLIGLISIVFVYFVANNNVYNKKGGKITSIIRFVLLFPVFLALSMGLSLHNSVAVLQGLFGKKTAFVRTPKLNIKTLSDKMVVSNYLKYKISFITILEGLLAFYFLFGVYTGIRTGENIFLIFHLLLFFGYAAIFFYSIKHLRYSS